MEKADRRHAGDIFEILCPQCVHREDCVVRTAGPDLFSELGPTAPPQTRGKSPGWPQGRPRTRPEPPPSGQKGQGKAQTGLKSARNSIVKALD